MGVSNEVRISRSLRLHRLLRHAIGEARSAMQDEDTLTSGAPKLRILLVEDERTQREQLARALSDEYIVDTAGSGTEALKAVMRVLPALIVTDIVMPDLDGIELLKT